MSFWDWGIKKFTTHVQNGKSKVCFSQRSLLSYRHKNTFQERVNFSSNLSGYSLFQGNKRNKTWLNEQHMAKTLWNRKNPILLKNHLLSARTQLNLHLLWEEFLEEFFTFNSRDPRWADATQQEGWPLKNSTYQHFAVSLFSSQRSQVTSWV